MLRSAEVAALFRERLGVSRTAFYTRYRPFLRARHLHSRRLVSRPEGGLDLVGRDEGQRFLRSEVVGLIAYLQAAAE